MSCQLRPQAALLLGKSPTVPLNRRLAGPRSRSVGFGEEKNFLPLPRIEPRYLASPGHALVSLAALGYYPGFSYPVRYTHETS